MKSAIVSARNLAKSFGYNGSSTWAVREVSLDAYPGELVLLMGPSGSGKTTLLTMIAGLVQPSTGSISLYGRPIEDYSEQERQTLRARRVGFVFQNFLLVDSLTVLDNVVLVMRFAGIPLRKAYADAKNLLQRFGIAHVADRLPPRLSQGEKQRTAIARAVANGAGLILADEPTASLESGQGFQIIRLLQQLAHEDQRCVLVATHDLRMTDQADRVVQMADGSIVSEHKGGNLTRRASTAVAAGEELLKDAGETPERPARPAISARSFFS